MLRITSRAKAVALAACFWSVPLALSAPDPDDYCASGSCSDESAVSLLQTSIDWSQKSLKKHTRVAETSFASAEALAASEKSCAVCFIGQFRNLNETKDKLWSQFLTPLTAGGVWVDVFIAGSPGGPFGISDFEPPKHHRRVKLRDARWLPELSAEEFEDQIVKSAPKEAVEHYRHAPGEWLGPAFGQPGNILRIYNHEDECADMIQQRERAHSIQYTWVLRTRPDILWLTPHPPLSIFSIDKVWTWDTQNWGGLNERHMVGGRDLMMNGDLRKYELILAGDPVIYRMNCSQGCTKEPEFRNPSGQGHFLIAETFGRYVAEKFSVPIAKMPTLGYLVDCPSWSNCWRAHVKDFVDKEHAPEDVNNVYDDERSAAELNAQRWDPLRSCWTYAEDGNIAMSTEAPTRNALREGPGGDARC